MFSTETLCTTLITPQDGDVPEVMGEFMGLAGSSLRFIIYGATHPVFFAGLKAAIARGVDVRGIFDHSQSAGPREAAQLHGLYLAAGAERFRIGTSESRHQIVHLKGMWMNYAGEADAKKTPAQFGTWQEAAKAGYPVTWSGSWNFSESATDQCNSVDLMPGILRAHAFQGAFDALWAFIDAHEQQYQRVA